MSDNLFENFTSRGFQLSAALAVACATMLATNSQVQINDNLSLKKTKVSFNENSYSIVWQEGDKKLNLALKPVQKDDRLMCIVIRATENDIRTDDFRVIHNINSHVPHENGRELKAKFNQALSVLLEKHLAREISPESGRGA